MADVTDSKSVGSDTVWVRVPPPAPAIFDRIDLVTKKPEVSGFFATLTTFLNFEGAIDVEQPFLKIR